MSLIAQQWQPLAAGAAPAWASAWGEDRSGPWASFEVSGVEQRLRWIVPGRFWMGSPESEAGRSAVEQRHEVELTEGYWLGEVPCTQALWEAVLGVKANRSRFRSADRPVDRVSWDDAQEFLKGLNTRVVGLDARLPSEAEWEYACRAGTETATYAGDLTLRGENDAPELDEIAWYGGNSGLGFELDNGYDSSDWPERQHAHERAGTRPVRLKRPHAWGLHDMLGNVLEWCGDWYYPDYDLEKRVNRTGPPVGHERVLRGGSWHSDAGRVRAACRLGWRPDERALVGFRLARGQGG